LGKRIRYLTIVILLTLQAAVAAFYGVSIWWACPTVVWNWAMRVLTVPVPVISLANLWMQVSPELLGTLDRRHADSNPIPWPISAETLEKRDV
jgi:hypothetical protein